VFEPTIRTPAFTINLKLETIYGQIGVPITDQFSVWLQGDFQLAASESSIFTQSVDYTFREDIGISLKYDFTSSLVLKAEYHEVSQGQQVLVPLFIPGRGFALDPRIFSIDNGSYWITSLSVSF